jgi:hypothetical protein
MSKPNYEEANLMIQLLRWGSETGFSEASNFLWSDEFEEDYEAFKQKYPWGSQEQKYASQLCGWYESLGALWVNELISEKLIGDWFAVAMVWERIKNYALGIREQSGNPGIHEHFEALAKALSD